MSNAGKTPSAHDFVLKLALSDDVKKSSIEKVNSSCCTGKSKEFRRVLLSSIGGRVAMQDSSGSSSRSRCELAEDSFDALMSRAKDYFVPNKGAKKTSSSRKVRLSYKDEDNDWVGLGSTEELHDAIASILDQNDGPSYLPIQVQIANLLPPLSTSADIRNAAGSGAAVDSTTTLQSWDHGRVAAKKYGMSEAKAGPQRTDRNEGSTAFELKFVTLVEIVAVAAIILQLIVSNVKFPFHVSKFEDNGTKRAVPISSATPLSTPPPPPSPSSQVVSEKIQVSSFDSKGANSIPTAFSQNPATSKESSLSTASTPGSSDPRQKPSPSPTSLPTAARQTETTPPPGRTMESKKQSDSTDLLRDMFADILQDDEGPSSPFQKAFNWMRSDPHWKEYPMERLRQRLGLVAFYFSTSGDTSWKRSDQWLSYEVDECSWFPGRFTMSICGEDHHDPERRDKKKKWQYERLWLPNNGLEGTLPPKLFQLLPTLRHVHLDRNIYLMGSLPSELALLTQISSLWLQQNMFSGTLPSDLGRLSSIEKLYLSENDLQGSIPRQLFRKTTNLRSLWLDHNRLTGHIPTDMALAPLMNLNLAHNHFGAGGLPCEMLGALTNLEQLVAPISMIPSSSLSSSELIIPTEVGLLTNLRSLDIYVPLSKWWSLSSHKWDRSEVATLYNLESLRVGTEGNDYELIDLMSL